MDSLLNNHFYGNRLASLSDLASKQWQDCFRTLEACSEAYLDFMLGHNLFPEGYAWPVDPLHNPTRIWEYPYVYHQLLKYLPLHSGMPKPPRIFDIGSALTFLPSFFASLGYQVKASDVDPAMKQSFELIKPHPNAPAALKELNYITCDCRNMHSEADASYDAIVCVSVLEHIAERSKCLKEFYRILKPKGLLILTVDIKLHFSSPGLDADEFLSLREGLCRYFDFLEPDRAIHPQDILSQRNCPKDIIGRMRYLERKKKPLLKRIFSTGRIKRWLKRKHQTCATLTVYGMTLVRKDGIIPE